MTIYQDCVINREGSVGKPSQFIWCHTWLKVKVKVTLVQALRLCTDRTACRGSRVIALPFHDHSTRRGWGVSITHRALFTPGKDPVPIVQEAGWAPGPVWTGAKNLALPPGFDPRTVQPVVSRYTGSYPAHTWLRATNNHRRNHQDVCWLCAVTHLQCCWTYRTTLIKPAKCFGS